MGHNDSAAQDSADNIVRMMRSALPGLLLISGLMNLMLLAIAFYFVLVGDVILPARNSATLVGLFLLTLILCLFYGGLGLFRARLLNDLAVAAEIEMADAMHEGVQLIARTTGGTDDGLQPLRDMRAVQVFLSSPTPAALLDLPWTLVAVVFLFLVHPWLGAIGLLATLAIAGILYLVERHASGDAEELAFADDERLAIAEEDRRNAHILRGLGMESRLRSRWKGVTRAYLNRHRSLAGSTTILADVGRAVRLIVLITLLTVGAGLAFSDEVSFGFIIGGAILFYQMLSPAEQAIAGWGGFAAARQSWHRVNQLLPSLTRQVIKTILPTPTATIIMEPIMMVPPGASLPALQNVGFQLDAGDALGVVGPTGAGKTTLLRVLTGAWKPARGVIRFDGAAIDQWDFDDFGRYVGYLPQNVDLMTGTIAQNIARFDPDATSDQIIAAAQAAGAHDYILRLPSGYETQVGRDGQRMSGGGRQRVGLARALFGDPFLVLLDEPGSNLDGEGEQALVQAIRNIRERQGIVVVVSQRPSILNAVEDIMVLRDGTMAAFGPRAQVMNQLLENRPAVSVKVKSEPADGNAAAPEA